MRVPAADFADDLELNDDVRGEFVRRRVGVPNGAEDEAIALEEFQVVPDGPIVHPEGCCELVGVVGSRPQLLENANPVRPTARAGQ